MQKMFKLEGLDCANCAAKVERGVGKIKGIDDVTVDFMSTKMAVFLENETPEIMQKLAAVVKKVDSNIVINEL